MNVFSRSTSTQHHLFKLTVKQLIYFNTSVMFLFDAS
jgi:hypothetical protein